MTPLLSLERVTKRFGGLAAVSGVDLRIGVGELVGLIGPNGAGKTTLFNLLTGVYAPTEGRIALAGRAIQGARPSQVTALGAARTFQSSRLFRHLTAMDNVLVAAHLRGHAGLVDAILHTPRLRRADARLAERAIEVLRKVNLEHAANAIAGDLPYGLQRRLEIARALATQPRLLLLDEPAAGMNPQEKAELASLIESIRQSTDLSILLIEHDMRVVMGICERIYVLDYGEVIAEGDPATIRANPKVVAAYLGQETA
ncbi:MAG: ABC transporter ATP-binding protein [Chthonomonadales bacterium]|nr:ABC transporter ATP-binding protein [Chthonomonadales bacterium]